MGQCARTRQLWHTHKDEVNHGSRHDAAHSLAACTQLRAAHTSLPQAQRSSDQRAERKCCATVER
eukprot:216014-Prymnesium_polylepis.1